jgi:hypothetical protein
MLRVVLTLTACSLEQQGSQAQTLDRSKIGRPPLKRSDSSAVRTTYTGDRCAGEARDLNPSVRHPRRERQNVRRVTVYGTSVLVAENGQIEGGPLNSERRPDRTG